MRTTVLDPEFPPRQVTQSLVCSLYIHVYDGKPMTARVRFVDRLATNQHRRCRAVYMPSPCQSKMSPAVKHRSVHRFGRRRQRSKPKDPRMVCLCATLSLIRNVINFFPRNNLEN